MFLLLMLAVAFVGDISSHPHVGTSYNYLPSNVPFRNEALFHGAAQHVQNHQPTGSGSYLQNQYQQSPPQIQYQTQPQHNMYQYQSNGRFIQPQNGGFTSQNSGFHTVGYADQAGFGPQSSDVYKSLYYFDSPEDIELPPPILKYADSGRNSKHYKVIFIKAPGYVQKPITDIQSNIGAAGGGKTIIYVLTKKPEAQQDIVINTGSAQQAVNKPEVYYIKYNSKQDAEQQISQSLNGQQGGAIPGRPLGSDQEFLSNIRDNIDVRAQGPIIKNIGNSDGVRQAPQDGAQILGFNQQRGNEFSTATSQGYSVGSSTAGFSGSTGFSTLAPSGYSSGSTPGGHIGYSTVAPQVAYGAGFTTDSYGNRQN